MHVTSQVKLRKFLIFFMRVNDQYELKNVLLVANFNFKLNKKHFKLEGSPECIPPPAVRQ